MCRNRWRERYAIRNKQHGELLSRPLGEGIEGGAALVICVVVGTRQEDITTSWVMVGKLQNDLFLAFKNE